MCENWRSRDIHNRNTDACIYMYNVYTCIKHSDIQGVPKNRGSYHIALVYFYLFANVNERIYTLTIKRLVCYKGCEN